MKLVLARRGHQTKLTLAADQAAAQDTGACLLLEAFKPRARLIMDVIGGGLACRGQLSMALHCASSLGVYHPPLPPVRRLTNANLF